MKRSNRLILLIGVFLAIVAFVGILLLMQTNTPAVDPNAPPTELPTVVATQDIPLGAIIEADQVTEETLPVTARNAGAFEDISQVIGQVARQEVVTGGQITAATLTGGAGAVLDIRCPAGLVCMSVLVDQVSAVGTVVKAGDYVDLIIGLQGASFPLITFDPETDAITPVAGVNATTVKAILQGMQVMGTLLPPPPATDPDAPPPADGGTTLNFQQQIVILAVNTQQAEVIKFAQLENAGQFMTLVLRSPDDFVDPVTGDPIVPAPIDTTGIILKGLVDDYGVLPPEVIEAILPEPDNDPTP